MLLYSNQNMLELACKFSDLLEEENLDFFEFPDKLEYLMGKATLHMQEQSYNDALTEMMEVYEEYLDNEQRVERVLCAQYYRMLGQLNKEVGNVH